MKKTLSFFCMPFFGLLPAIILSAGTPTISEDVKDIVISRPPLHPEGSPRSSSAPIITASLDDELFIINLSFQNAGSTITVELENLDTLESSCVYLPGDGLYYLPFSGNTGSWVIHIFLENGDEYVGSFTL